MLFMSVLTHPVCVCMAKAGLLHSSVDDMCCQLSGEDSLLRYRLFPARLGTERVTGQGVYWNTVFSSAAHSYSTAGTLCYFVATFQDLPFHFFWYTRLKTSSHFHAHAHISASPSPPLPLWVSFKFFYILLPCGRLL